MDIRVEQQMVEHSEDDAAGFFALGVANSAIAGKCGNGGHLGPLKARIVPPTAPDVEGPAEPTRS